MFGVGVEIKPVVYIYAEKLDDWFALNDGVVYLDGCECRLAWGISEPEQFGLLCGELQPCILEVKLS